MTASKIIIALDFEDDKATYDFVNQLPVTECRLKVGSILYTRYGPKLVEKLMQKGFDVFLDLKFHDIPQTVAGACQMAAQLGVWMVNVHALGGEAMLQAAANAVQKSLVKRKPILLAVTVLTSLTATALKAMAIAAEPEAMVAKLATLAEKSGVDGVVCSPQEAAMLREKHGKEFVLVTPGIRLDNKNADDQKRIMTPEQAINAGANYLVIGRPITQANDPLTLLKKLNSIT